MRKLLFLFPLIILIVISCSSNHSEPTTPVQSEGVEAVPMSSGSQQVVTVNGKQVTIPSGFNEKAGEYFLAMMLHADFDGSRFLKTSRITKDPIFWFKNGHGTQGKQEVESLLQQAVQDYTGGKFTARFHNSTTFQGDKDTVITVEFGNTSYGSSRPQSANWSNGGGLIITGGYIVLSNSFKSGINQWNEGVPVHELGHVMLGAGGHPSFPDAIMTQKSVQPPLPAYEKAAWTLFHRLPVGTSINDLQQAGVITTQMMNVEPTIFETSLKHKWPGQPHMQAAVGDTIYLEGQRFRYQFKCSSSLNWSTPEVSFNGTKASYVTEPTNIVQSDCNWIEMRVPIGATTGPLTVTSSYGKTSNQVQFTITSRAVDFSGKWDTDFGELRLHQFDKYVVGDYADQGIMLGKVKENCVSGIFTNGDRSGIFRFNAPQFGQFNGEWAWHGDPLSGSWNGSRTSKSVTQLSNFTRDGSKTQIIDNNRTVYDGTYDSSYGEIKLLARDLFLVGDYASRGVFAGIWDGNSYVGIFTNEDETGWFDFSFYSSNGTFDSGSWGWIGKSGRGSWSLTETDASTPAPSNMLDSVQCN
ncbi:hypothetical protein [Fodinibius halophilus]|uniref:IPT/TIG domain-containing protein n=1 Tax=Fodinibius halophilus TaxID=1736908 RepID=A0A6M1T2I6_9BACT|nr:hypothetical protein [Fodinibius halophilus]NGP88237.1 hypothetical protein [Fodinibius halophilus]